MRTREQEHARYTYLRPSEVAEHLGCDDDLVRDHIHAGAFPDVGNEPGVVNIGTGKTPQYRIHPESLRAFVQRARVAA